jgi:hypothetical protein
VRKRSWRFNDLKQAAQKSTSLRQVLRCLHLKEAGGNYAQLKKYIEEYDIDICHFKGKAWNKGLRGNGRPRISLDQILILGSSYQSFKFKKGYSGPD